MRLSDYERSRYECIKLAPRWSEPRRITTVLENGVTYDVSDSDGGTTRVHVSRLLPLGEAYTEVTDEYRSGPCDPEEQEDREPLLARTGDCVSDEGYDGGPFEVPPPAAELFTEVIPILDVQEEDIARVPSLRTTAK